jgi:hypothetical protein
MERGKDKSTYPGECVRRELCRCTRTHAQKATAIIIIIITIIIIIIFDEGKNDFTRFFHSGRCRRAIWQVRHSRRLVRIILLYLRDRILAHTL